MRITITTLLLLITLVSQAQTGLLMKRYYISGSLALGQDERAFADSSAWLQIGSDTTDKGLAFPKVLLDSINTSERALFVYDLLDSVLYHFDGTDRVRYMTYKDTSLVKQIVLDNAPDLSPFVEKADTARDSYAATYYYTDSLAGTKMSYADTLGAMPTKNYLAQNYFINGGNSFGAEAIAGTKDMHPLSLYTYNQSRLKIFANGNVAINTEVDDGFKLNVNGSIKVSGESYINNKLVFNSSTHGIQLEGGLSTSLLMSIMIGKNNGAYPTTGNRHIRIGTHNISDPTRVWQYSIGQGNNLLSAGNSAFAIGNFNTISTTESEMFIFGESNTISFPSTTTSRGQCIIGTNNSVLHKYSSVIGNFQRTTGNNQLIIAEGNTNSGAGGYRDVYFGSGPSSTLLGGVGAPVTIHASGGNGVDKQGGLLRLAAGKSTGASTPGDVIIATSDARTTGDTLQSLADRWYIKGETGRLSNHQSPTSTIDIDGASAYNQLRLRLSYTPSSSADANGNTGDVCWDTDYIYVKTASGWKRSPLSTF